MKKFLSLVLTLIMTMSLVTISAGATEYKDLTDKSEIQYEEAVAVLNRIGVITGYDDGSFRPEGELTRGAAAKIIVSLLIGPEAANNLPNTYAPYPDVPANHTFAGVISFCKTAEIISGYGDGTFKPGNSLTGYAFAKMLLGALGYDSKIQGYVDTGWTMNVARDGSAAGLFNRIEFDGAAAVNREEACQLALNTLKATMVEYSGGLNITAGDATVTSQPTLTYKISNQEYASHINNKKLNTTGNADMSNHWTVEFGEEHFKDLRMSHDRTTNDKFGRPSNEWSYKKVTIGTFPIEPDFVYTALAIHNDDAKVTDAAKVRALELNGYELREDDTKESDPVDTNLWLNGEKWTGSDLMTEGTEHTLKTVGNIADYTDNGTVVEVYVDDDDADFIRDVVVVKTQLMEVKSQKSEAVALKLYDDGSDTNYMGFNSKAINEDVNDVQINDDCYSALKDMKVGDIVAVIPVYTGVNSKYDVARVYVPETVSGELTNVETYGQAKDGEEDEAAITATVGGADYKVALWNKDLTGIDGTKIRVTRKDVTLHLDEFGNALLATNVGSTSNFMVVGGYHSGLVDGKVVTFVDGWDIKGNELSLNVGNMKYDTIWAKDIIGELVHYSSNTSSKYAEWDIDYLGVFDVASKRPSDDGSEAKEYSLKASSSKVLLNGWTATGNDSAGADTFDFYKGNDVDGASSDFLATGKTFETKNIDVDDAGVKVIYVTMDSDDNEVDSIEIKDGMQAISNNEILGLGSSFAHKRAQACVALKNSNTEVRYDDSVVKAIVIKEESGSANLKDLVYISNYIGSAGVAAGSSNNSKPVYGYEAHFIGQTDYDKPVTIYSYKDLKRGDFARARLAADAPTEVKNVTEENFYNLTKYGDTVNGQTTEKIHKALSVLPSAQIKDILSNNKTLLRLTAYDVPTKTNTGITPYATAERTNVDGQANITLNLNDISELDLGDESAASIVSINKARFIDLTDNDVDNATDLKELWNDVTDAQKAAYGKDVHRLITLTLLFNDKYDDDGFRDVHAVIITSAPKNSVYTVEEEEEVKAGKLTISGDADGYVESSIAKDANIPNSTDFTVTVKDGYKATAVSGATYKSKAGNVYTFTSAADAATTGAEIKIEVAATGAVSTELVDRYGNDKLEITNSSVTVNANGSVSWVAEITVPEWVALSSPVVASDIVATGVDYSVYDGTTLKGTKTSMSGSVTVQPVSGNKFILSASGTGSVGVVEDTNNVNVVITAIQYANAKIRYYADAEKTEQLTKDDFGAGTIEALSTSTVSANGWLFSVKADLYKAGVVDTGDVVIEGVLKDANDTAFTAGEGTIELANNTATGNVYLNGTSAIKADNNGYVDVVIEGLEEADPVWKFTAADEDLINGTGVAISEFGVDSGNANKDAVLKIANKVGADGLTGLKDGTSVQLEASFTGTNSSDWQTDANKQGFVVQLKVGSTTLYGYSKDGDGTAFDLVADPDGTTGNAAWITMDKDYAITDVVVTYIPKVALKGTAAQAMNHEVGSTIYEITLNTPVMGSGADGAFALTDVTTDGADNDVVGVTATGAVLTVRLAKELGDGEKINLTTAITSIYEAANAITSTDLTVTISGGAESWA